MLFFIITGKNIRGLMVIKQAPKTKALQRKQALRNWKVWNWKMNSMTILNSNLVDGSTDNHSVEGSGTRGSA